MDYREYVVDYVRMVHVVYHRRNQKVYVEQIQIQLPAGNFLRQVAAGSGCYTHVVENTARRLKEMAQELQAEGKKPKYKDSVAKLAKILQINCCGNCGPDCHNSCAKTTEMIADAVLADIRKPYDEKMTLMKHIALPKRYEVWEKLWNFTRRSKRRDF